MRALTMDEIGCVGGGAVMEEVTVTGQRIYDWWDPLAYLVYPRGFFNADREGKYAQTCANAAVTKYSAITACYDTDSDLWLGLGAGYSSGKGLSYEATVAERKLDGVYDIEASTTVDHKIYNVNGEVTGVSSDKYGSGVSVKENVSQVFRDINSSLHEIGLNAYRYYKGMEMDLTKVN
jgi:hypothetical protein